MPCAPQGVTPRLIGTWQPLTPRDISDAAEPQGQLSTKLRSSSEIGVDCGFTMLLDSMRLPEAYSTPYNATQNPADRMVASYPCSLVRLTEPNTIVLPFSAHSPFRSRSLPLPLPLSPSDAQCRRHQSCVSVFTSWEFMAAFLLRPRVPVPRRRRRQQGCAASAPTLL